MTKHPAIHAIAATVYIGTIVLLMDYLESTMGSAPETFSLLMPIAFLSLLTLSVAIMGYLFFFQPVMLFLAGQRKEGAVFFVQTIGVFALITILLFAIVLLFVVR